MVRDRVVLVSSLAPLWIVALGCSSAPGSAGPVTGSHHDDAGAVAPPKAGGDAGAENAAQDGAPGEAPHAALDVTLDGKGRVTSDPPGIDCPGTCSAPFAAGTSVKLTPTAAEGWRWTGWSGACSGSDPCEVVVAQDATVKGSLVQIDPRWDPSFGAADCRDAWGTAGEKLSRCDKTPDDYVVVRKSARNVASCHDGALTKNFRSGLGFAPVGAKEKAGDGKTPEGVFFVPRVLPTSEYYKAFLIGYPTKDDAERGLTQGLITQAEHDQIVQAQDDCTEPSQDTGLGGAVEIHGDGSSQDWTAGCVAVDNSTIDDLWGALEVGDTIVIVP